MSRDEWKVKFGDGDGCVTVGCWLFLSIGSKEKFFIKFDDARYMDTCVLPVIH